MKRTFWRAAIALLALASAAAPCLAQGISDFDSAALYRSNCAPCHGVTGMGGGPVAAALKKPMPMIATLTERHGGTFPADHVYRVIDGRKQVTAHGSRVMPVWGALLDATHHGGGTEQSTKLMIEALIAHIKRLQIQ
ncbi:MAG: c-type cytochrome [Hyphomicrobiales bacterium]